MSEENGSAHQVNWIVNMSGFRREPGNYIPDILDGYPLLIMHSSDPWALAVNMNTADKVRIGDKARRCQVNRSLLKDSAGEVQALLRRHGVVMLNYRGEVAIVSIPVAIEARLLHPWLMISPHMAREIAYGAAHYVTRPEGPRMSPHPTDEAEEIIGEVGATLMAGVE